MELVASFVRNPVKVTVGVILVALFGTIALVRMPIQLTPEVEIPTVTIETAWIGASPQEIESEIIQPQEEQLQSVEGVTKMTSESMDSMGRIVLEFAVGADMSEALLMTDTRLQQVKEYPENVDKPVITSGNSANQWIAWFILTERMPDPDVFREFAASHPDLSSEMAAVTRADNQNLALFRLRRLAEQHAEVRDLLPPSRDITKFRRFARDFIEARFENVEGISDSSVFGGQEEELQVVVDPQSLASRQLTIGSVRAALALQNKDTSGGDFWEGKRRYVVRTLGQFDSIEDVENAILARRNGAPVHVRDVARVRLGYKKPDGSVQRYGNDVIAINASRKTGANVLTVMEGLRQAVDELNQGILQERGLQLAQVYDETEYINASVDLVNDNVLEGSVLTFIVLLLFLRSFRSTLIVFVSIGVSIVGMFLLMSLLGRSLNVLSLAGIAFAVGMLVDNFIVVLENIYRHYQAGDDPLSATVRGTKEVWGAVLAATLANLAVFVPVLFVQDQAGQLFRDIALAAASALICSLLVALIVVPTAAGRILRGQSESSPPAKNSSSENGHGGNGAIAVVRRWRNALGDTRHSPRGLWAGAIAAAVVLLIVAWWTSDLAYALAALLALALPLPLQELGRNFVRIVVETNGWILDRVSRRLIVAAALIFGSLALSWLLTPKREYLPNGNRNLVIGLLLPPPGYNLDHMRELGRLIEARLEPYWDVATGDPDADPNSPAIADFFYVARGRQLFLGLRALDPLRAADLVPLLRSATNDLPGVFAVAAQRSLFEQGITSGRSIDVEITGPDIEKLVGLGGRIMGQVFQSVRVESNGAAPPAGPAAGFDPDAAQARPTPSLDLSSPEMHVVPKWQQAADMGLSAQELGYAVDALVDGAFAGYYFTGGDKIDISIVGSEQFASRTQDLAALSLAVPSGELISLAAVAEVRYANGPEQINHRRRQRAITIQVTPPPAMPLENAMDIIRDEIVAPIAAEGQLAGGYQIVLSGTVDKLTQTWGALGWNLALAVVITYLLMAALFESWLYPLVIILSVPLGAVGGLLGLRLLNLFFLQALDVMTMLGFIILVGTVVNNPILIVEQALLHIREDGMTPRQAVLESVRTRIRPIFMTALIALFGLLPLVISPGAGAELYRGLGSVMLGGLLVSTVFTLFLVPTLFSLALEARTYVQQRLFGSDRAESPVQRDPLEPLEPLRKPAVQRQAR